MTSELVFRGGGRERTLTVIRRACARGLRLSVDPRDASVRLSLAPRAPLRPALAWAGEKRGWIEAELARMPMPQPIVPGMVFGLGGALVRLDWSPKHPRTPCLDRGSEAVLRVGGPVEQLSPRVLRYLKRHALATLEAESRALAAQYGLTLGKVGVGDPRARWGSCASGGDIRYSWRLILAPEHVRLATVAHEVAHLVHMNHGAAFHALVKSLLGSDPAPARRWLRQHGVSLHWFGRAS
jgi:predicted metal-dependent hydrolase